MNHGELKSFIIKANKNIPKFYQSFELYLPLFSKFSNTPKPNQAFEIRHRKTNWQYVVHY